LAIDGVVGAAVAASHGDPAGGIRPSVGKAECPVQGRLHRSRRDLELLDEVGPDPHRDDDGDEDDLDVLLPGGGFVVLHRLLARFGEFFSHHLEFAAFLRRVFDSGKEGDILGEDLLLLRPVDEVVVVTEKLAHPFGEGPPLLAPVLVERPLGEFLLAGFFEKEHSGDFLISDF
jgi:hypothetical protein